MTLSKQKLANIVIFGRTNVGKSTLFNCLTEKSQALVANAEGTTRDSNIGEVEWQRKKFQLIDTGGILDLKYLTGKKIKTNDIEIKVQQQAKEYLTKADLVLFVVDNKTGLLPQDRQMAIIVKKIVPNKKIILVVNKTDSPSKRAKIADFYKLSLGEPIPVSAASGSGTGDLLDIIIKKNKSKKDYVSQPENENKIKVCILGKPNVGKSSLLNSILGYERVIVSPIPHTTREPQDTEITYKNHLITLVDTAGISKKGRKTKGLEKHGIDKSLSILKKADITLMVFDINEELTRQESKIAEEILNRKKSLILIANKWDLIKEKDTKKFTQYINGFLPFTRFAPIQFVSALTGSKVDKIMDLIIEIKKSREIKISDSQLTKFLNSIVKIHKPAKGKGNRHPRIYKLSQVRTNPPQFELNIGKKDDLHFSYVRFIENRLRDKFNFAGAPITVKVKKESSRKII